LKKKQGGEIKSCPKESQQGFTLEKGINLSIKQSLFVKNGATSYRNKSKKPG